ncbi:paclitaxel/taxanoid biosynthesis susceptibility protein TS1 [Scytonema hofmannii PCC 7110]|uniref:Paclitaxel/taxanoid biosynthesis susceptibility protein TS1 n=1 Tax=Scytonema hofmannii PCC 7110 TaxID=128403 RepID=A0A139X0N8_9CYAN|nr:RNA-guided endonuclease IscB [Scytonema hofmannii]KYC35548.1 paclitaxel/taxanoid biosynthesis susceptibility protein TS1 [Scytonema hofmannii PCC 7110]KYC38271.1 paclitaxel/taxanoid biosynthesis susceptibility protein TS1 [Scytonema hofmannii PCC 7110]KYC41370.1 paclitaxel/taxanoid biosynthesis susceptibility protein TS1 [Scytonema hofmannii PCC 7110]KYC43145.1 paclitaxel/taxanoid biosynthesis susceptibility protein TS1 [Scytonema hofmannii PCC 7110]
MKVYVVNKHGKPLMPTTPRKARLLLKEGKAKIYCRAPFTIQLIYGSSGYTQPGNLGIDAGYQNIGYSVVNEKEELIGGEVQMLKGVSERLTERKKYRQQRRNRKRYRAPRFDNRRRKDNWLAPSIQHKLDTHHKIIDKIQKIVPVKKITIEVASFDIQRIKDAEIQGVGYQQGEKYGFDNLREYILHRDGHKCQNPNCKNKDVNPILEVHHLGFWKEDRTDRPANLITLCNKCHASKNHKKSGFLCGWEPKLKSFKGETFMTTVRWRLTNDGRYSSTYGYITKGIRREFKIEKSHHNDAFVVAGGTIQKRVESLILEQIRRNKRSMEQFYDAKYIDSRDGSTKSGSELSSGRRTRNKQKNGENLRLYRKHKVSKGQRRIKKYRYRYQPKDLVQFEGQVYEVIGMQNLGTGVKLKNYPGVKNKVVNVNKVNPVKRRSGLCQIVP